MKDKVAFVFGATGQIGSYLTEYLCRLEYGQVIGIARRVSNPNIERLKTSLEYNNFKLDQGDITDTFSLAKLFNKYINDKDNKYEVYNLAAASHVHTSFSQPKLYADITGIGHLNILESCLQFHNANYNIRVYGQFSSEVFGGQKAPSGYQTLDTKMWPNSPYAAAKLYAFHMNRIYRESYGMWNSGGIIFNTESPRRGEDFVTRKITRWFGEFAANGYELKNKLNLGNVHACRDWTHAQDMVRAIHLINTTLRPKDYLVASGETHSVKNFMEVCYEVMEDNCGNCPYDLEELFEIDVSFLRPNEVPFLKGQADVIRTELGWQPEIPFYMLVREMFLNDYSEAASSNHLISA